MNKEFQFNKDEIVVWTKEDESTEDVTILLQRWVRGGAHYIVVHSNGRTLVAETELTAKP